MDWDQLIDENELKSLLGAAYEPFTRPVKEALVVFLSGLPREWQDQVVARQVELPFDAPLAERLGALAHACPVLHKLGQILARDQRLAAELREHLRPLESLPPQVCWDDILADLNHELGPLPLRGIELLPPALAEASVAVVIPYRNQDRNGTAGVLKVLKPNIERRLNCELELLGRVGAHLDERCHEYGIPELDYRHSFEQVRTKLSSEVHLDQEQRHLALAADFYAHDPEIHIPRVFEEHCTPRVTAMERVSGVDVTKLKLTSARAARRLSTSIARALISRPLFTECESALFHCDPHAGNLMVADDGRLAILDWSLTAKIDESERIALTRIVLAASSLDAVQLKRLLSQLSVRGAVCDAELDQVVRTGLGRCRRGEAPGATWLVDLLDDAAQRARMRVSAPMMLFRKSAMTLMGLCSELCGRDFDLDEVLFPEFMKYFVSEWPTRWTAPFRSREFGTRISNCDLAQFVCNLPITATRFWTAMTDA